MYILLGERRNIFSETHTFSLFLKTKKRIARTDPVVEHAVDSRAAHVVLTPTVVDQLYTPIAHKRRERFLLRRGRLVVPPELQKRHFVPHKASALGRIIQEVPDDAVEDPRHVYTGE